MITVPIKKTHAIAEEPHHLWTEREQKPAPVLCSCGSYLVVVNDLPWPPIPKTVLGPPVTAPEHDGQTCFGSKAFRVKSCLPFKTCEAIEDILISETTSHLTSSQRQDERYLELFSFCPIYMLGQWQQAPPSSETEIEITHSVIGTPRAPKKWMSFMRQLGLALTAANQGKVLPNVNCRGIFTPSPCQRCTYFQINHKTLRFIPSSYWTIFYDVMLPTYSMALMLPTSKRRLLLTCIFDLRRSRRRSLSSVVGVAVSDMSDVRRFFKPRPKVSAKWYENISVAIPQRLVMFLSMNLSLFLLYVRWPRAVSTDIDILSFCVRWAAQRPAVALFGAGTVVVGVLLPEGSSEKKRNI